MSTASHALQRAFIGRAPLVHLTTWEEERAVALVRRSGKKILGDDVPVVRWSTRRGWYEEANLTDGGAPVAAGEHREPLEAIAAVCGGSSKGIFVLHDLLARGATPEVLRALREAYQALRRSDRFLVITEPPGAPPDGLAEELFGVDLTLPEPPELEHLVDRFRRSYPEREISDELATEMAFGLRGLSLVAAEQTLNRVFRQRGLGPEAVLAEIFSDKERAVRQSGYLEYIQPKASIDQIGGLDQLKGWVERRRSLFSREALAGGLPVPKGMLVMGMSGCGKSLAAKVVSHHWGIPLFRLDMNMVSSGLYGTPEAAFDRALRTIEGLAPAVLWIDEIENSLGMDGGEHQGNARVFSSFLTWMQEKPPFIFVAATANRISALPAEVIRKGRFDQVFFVDLPTQGERESIFRVHLEAHGADLEAFNLELLAIATRGWNGAEIEQAVASARIDAYSEDRTFDMQDLTRNTGSTVPLSKTMHEQMKQIRNWAFGRATLASSERFSESDSVALG